MDSAQTAVPRINAAQILGGEHTVVSTAVYLRNFAKVLTKIGGSAYLHFYFTLRILLRLRHYDYAKQVFKHSKMGCLAAKLLA